MDWVIVLTHHGPKATAYGMHRATAVLMLATAGPCRRHLPDHGSANYPPFLIGARALQRFVTLDKLIPGGDDERIELGDGAEVSPRWIREMLTGDFYRDRPLEDLPYERFPVDELMADALIRSEAEKKRVDVLAQPILEWAKQHDVKLAEGDWLSVFETASDTERRAARRLGVEIA